MWTRAGRSHLDVKCVLKRWIVHSKVFFWGGGLGKEGERDLHAHNYAHARAHTHTLDTCMHSPNNPASHTHIQTNTPTCMHPHKHICACTETLQHSLMQPAQARHTSIKTHTQEYEHTTYLPTYLPTYLHTYTHTHTHTHTQTHRHTDTPTHPHIHTLEFARMHTLSDRYRYSHTQIHKGRDTLKMSISLTHNQNSHHTSTRRRD